jgi:hypothetical protein
MELENLVYFQKSQGERTWLFTKLHLENMPYFINIVLENMAFYSNNQVDIDE